MRVRQISLVVLLAAAGVLAALSIRQVSVARIIPASEAPIAMMGARWGMSLEQVSEAVGSRLERQPSAERYLEVADKDQNKVASYRQAEAKILGRPAKVVYTFYADRLASVHAFVSDVNGAKITEDFERYLTRVHGKNYSVSGEENQEKWIWQTKDLIVNYWTLEDELSMRPKRTAVYGVVYRPIAGV